MHIGLHQQIYNHTIAHSLRVTHMHTYIHNHHIDTRTHTCAQHPYSLKNTDIQYIQTHVYTNTRLQYNKITRTLTYTHKIHKYSHIYTYLSIHTYTHTITHAYTCVLIFSVLKMLKLTLVHTNAHILLTYTTLTTHTYTHTHTTHTLSNVYV